MGLLNYNRFELLIHCYISTIYLFLLMNYYRHFSLLLIAFLASIFVFGNIDQVFDSIYAQTQGDSEDPLYPYPVLHKIDLSVQKIEKPGGGGDLYGYQLDQHLLFNSNTGEFLN